jgi:hypothetical protein
LQGLFWIALKLHCVSGSPLRCGRNGKFSRRVIKTGTVSVIPAAVWLEAEIRELGSQGLMSKGNDIVVFIPTRNSSCGECKQELGRGAWISLDRKKNAFCLNCADKVYPKVSRILDRWEHGGSQDKKGTID